MVGFRFPLVFVLVWMLTSSAWSQRIEVGMSGGGASYLGDLNPYHPLKLSGISAGAFGKYNFNRHLGLGLHYNYGKVEANDAESSYQQLRDRNLSFENGLHEISFMLDFNLFDLTPHYRRNTRFSPYIFAGFGILIFNPKTTYKGEEYKLRGYRTEGQAEIYKGFTPTFPYGVGIKYKLKENWTIFSQIGYRSPLTDYIDDVSGVYPERSFFLEPGTPSASAALSDRSGENTNVYLGEPGTQRGDFRKRDNYMFVGIGISYTFVSQKCFTF